MTETAQAMIPLTEIPVSERELAKADILESYLFSSLVHSAETLTATLTTTMKTGEEKINALALLQILQRFHLESVKISALVIHGVLADEPFDETLFVPWDDEGKGRTIRLLSNGNDVTLAVSGTPPENGKNGEILETFFDKGSSAGKIMDDGSIDFRELLKYPSAKAGDLLLQVSLPEVEKNGLSHDGNPIEATTAKEHPIQLGDNVEKVYITTEDGRPGFDVKSMREGVVMTRMGNEGITFIDVNDRIVVGNIDFSVGNIGSDVVCPVSMQALSVNEGFEVKVAGSVSIKTIAGGKVESGKKAEVDQMLPGSRLTAGGETLCRSVSASTVTCNSGTLSVKREAIDSELNANRVLMNASASLLLNSTINACVIDLSNVRVSGTNHIILGPGIFDRRNKLVKDKERVETALREAEEVLNEGKATLVGELKGLSAEFGEDDAVRPIFKQIVTSLKAYDFEKTMPLMVSLKRVNNCMAVNGAMRTVEMIKRQLERYWELEERVKGLAEAIAEVEAQLETITFSVSARLRPSAVVNIHLDTKERKPLVLSPPQGKNDDHAVRIRGKFTMKNGLEILEQSG